MTVSNNVLRKIQAIWDTNYEHQYFDHQDGSQEFVGDYLLCGFLDACVKFGFMTDEESGLIFDNLVNIGERIDDVCSD